MLFSVCLLLSGRLNLKFFCVSADGGGESAKEGLLVPLTDFAFAPDIRESIPDLTFAFRAFLSGAANFLASSTSLKQYLKSRLSQAMLVNYLGSTSVCQIFGSFS